MILGSRPRSPAPSIHLALPPPPLPGGGGRGASDTNAHAQDGVSVVAQGARSRSTEKALRVLPEDQPGTPVSSDLKPQILIVEFFPFFLAFRPVLAGFRFCNPGGDKCSCVE